MAGVWYPASFGTLAPDTWYHLAATYDGETLNAYKDGILVTSNPDPSGPPDSETETLKIGRAADTNPHYFQGVVDDVQVFARALSDAEIQTLTNGEPDVTPPQISNVAVSASATMATVTWTTDEPSDSAVNYGPDAGLGTLVSDATAQTSHQVTLTGLTPLTSYYFEVSSKDLNGNLTTDDNGGLLYTFTTAALP